MTYVREVVNYAHRGFSKEYPENTMLAFEKAIEAGATGIETDVQLTKDGVAVLCHDEYVNRTTNGTGPVNSYTYAELKELDAGSKFNPKFKGLKIPTLDQLLSLAKEHNIMVNIELKNDTFEYPGLETLVISHIKDFGIEHSTIISSFNHYSLVKCKEIDGSIKTGMLYAGRLYHPELCAELIHANAVHPYFRSMLHKDAVYDIRCKGLLVNPYTVNEEVHMRKLLSLGVDGIITNRPDKLNEIMNE